MLGTGIFFCLLMSGCKNHLAEMPDVGVATDEINTRFRLSAPRTWNSFKTEDVLSLVVDVTSEEKIKFEADYGARIFLFENEQWTEIPNSVEYPPEDIVLSPSRNDPFQWGDAIIRPVLPDRHETVRVRIVLVGNVYQDNQVTDKLTAAYIDLELQP